MSDAPRPMTRGAAPLSFLFVCVDFKSLDALRWFGGTLRYCGHSAAAQLLCGTLGTLQQLGRFAARVVQQLSTLCGTLGTLQQYVGAPCSSLGTVRLGTLQQLECFAVRFDTLQQLGHFAVGHFVVACEIGSALRVLEQLAALGALWALCGCHLATPLLRART